ncbi:hypothetical protein Q2K19_06890 [Micromonospora soli]|uniref:hypothetical protein n=1 Tax=Micromonospora sp. NBRC 110009 TaxID=3061627 RepID=UPI002673DD1D|nr:hypothetical protein [Micromonospora sp. NBRC 110009]WKU00208.1 hypothetical protein Q2K19_06890 [Micromonospora sp. NBRC 110009]
MRDDVTFVELLQRDLREVRWPEPAEIRTTARRRSRRTAVAAAAAVLAVASVSAVAVGRAGTPTPAPPGTGVGGRAEISAEAMLTPADVPAETDERLGDTGLDERVRVDDILRTCAQEQGLPTDQAVSRYSRSQTLMGTVEVDGFAPYRRPVISQDVYRLDPGAADRLFADLDRSVAACAGWGQMSRVQRDQGMVDTTVVHQWTVAASAFAGDQAILLRHTMSVEADPATGEPVAIPPRPEDRLVVRVGDLVTVLVPEDPLQPGVPGNTMTQARLLDLARAAAGRLCVAANPGC